MELTSPVFKHNSSIPALYTCDGENFNPPFIIKHIPGQAKSLVLICVDPDVPKYIRSDGLYVHWVVFNINPNIKQIEEGIEPGGIKGLNTSGKVGYTGPCPPDKEHRYFFKLYALSEKLDLPEGSSKSTIELAMNDYIIEQTELIGLYERQKI